MTAHSTEEFAAFLIQLSQHESQVIELNSFAEQGVNSEKIAQCFVDSIINRLPSQMTEPSVNIYGNVHVSLNFEVDNWNRIDVYYFLGPEKANTVQINYDGNEGEPDTVAVYDMEAEALAARRDPPSLDEIVEGVPIVTPITFIGGKAKVTPESYPYLEYLNATLLKHQELSAHIRGHVCCGKNQRISNKRAKAVYKYLVKHGISKDRLSYKGYSNTIPVAWPEKTMEDRKANRRVDIIFKKAETDETDETTAL